MFYTGNKIAESGKHRKPGYLYFVALLYQNIFTMAIKYKVIGKKNPAKITDPAKFYATTVLNGAIDLRELCKEIEKISTVSEADILAVLSSLVYLIPDKLANGHIVRIGDLGDFRPSLSSEGRETEKDVSVTAIKGSKVLFRPGKRIKNVMKVVDYKKV